MAETSGSVDTSSPSPWPAWGLKSNEEGGKGSAPPLNPTLVEVHEWVRPSHCNQHDNCLRPGHLLRWMDITACLSGMLGSRSLGVLSGSKN